MTAITLTKDDRGDFEMHIAGCADIARKARRAASRDGSEVSTYGSDSSTLLDAIIEADTDMAAWFGQEAYEVDPAEQPWNTRHVQWAPCFVKAVKGQHIQFGEQDRPESFGAPYIWQCEASICRQPSRDMGTDDPGAGRRAHPGCQDDAPASCLCGCGGVPKGKRSRFLPGHDAKAAAAGRWRAALGVPRID